MAGFDSAGMLLLIERMGVIVNGITLLTRRRMKAEDQPAISGRDLVAAAEAALASLDQRGRAFVAGRHADNRVRVIPNFWEKKA